MTKFSRIVAVSCLFAMMSFAVPQVHAQVKDTNKINATALKVEMIQSEEITLPAAFQVAIYESVIQQLKKKADFLHVYRDGDNNAANVPGLVIFHSTVIGFKQGSEDKRRVTAFAGVTSITIHCQFIDNQGKVLLGQDVDGKVSFFGDDLKATYDFAKKAAAVVSENFSAVGRS